ncbi:serine/threonine-protein kinase [Pseudokineococcus sp. 1T1Z-3]|uniref:serine/threonine-protein kinase n=1 Tax=Pseudokineococcus sp. 1T1Z-3 TaxID=3132745 RepID=UPI0030B19055
MDEVDAPSRPRVVDRGALGRGAASRPVSSARLGPYRLLQRVGEGGMGVVHLALDADGRAVAVKVLRPHIADDPSARERLRREVAVLRRVRHRRVAEVLDADPDGPQPYVVTQFVPARSLQEHVEEEGPLAPAALARLADGLGRALAAVHDAGVVHRDLKPSNVLMLDGDPVVIDFGIARVADEATALTSPGLVMGTAGYLPPELLEGAEVGPSADWWGWAATTAFAATGRPPFGRGPVTAVLDRVRRGRADLDGVPPELRAVLAAALSPDARERPGEGWLRQAVEELAAAAAREPHPRPSAGDAAATSALASLAGAGVDDEMTSAYERPGPASPDEAHLDEVQLDEVHLDEALPDEGDAGRVRWTEDGSDRALGTVPAAADAPTTGLDADEAPTTALGAVGGGRWDEPSGAAAAAGAAHLPNGADHAGRSWDLAGTYADDAAREVAAHEGAVADHAPASTPPREARGGSQDHRRDAGHRFLRGETTGATEAVPRQPSVPAPADEAWAGPTAALPSSGPGGQAGGADPWARPRPHPDGPLPAIAAGPPQPPRPRRDRPGLRAAWAAALVGLCALAPVVGVLVGAALVVLARTVERGGRWVDRRRELLGPRRGDVALAVLRSPLSLLPATVSTVAALLLPLAVAAAVLFLVGVLLGDAGVVPGDPVSLAAGAASGVVLAWYGPGGYRLRRGAVLLTRAAPGGPVGRVLVVVALLVVVAAVWLAVTGTTPDWRPLPWVPPGL